MDIIAYQHGVYPRSEALVRATRDLDRSRTTPGAVASQAAEDLAAFVRLQQDSALDHLSDGLLRWQDLFRPLVEASRGMNPGGLVRYFDNNSFFRTPQVEGPVSIEELPPEILGDALPPPRLATLPSPFLFSRAASGDFDPDALMEEVARQVLRPAVESLDAADYEVIHLEEPWLGFFGIEKDSYAPFEKALSTITEGIDARVHLHVYFGDASRHADLLRELPVDSVGFDFMETDLDALGSSWPAGVVAGVIDGRSSVIEDAGAVAGFLRRVLDRLEPPHLTITSSSELELLGEPMARRKVQVLGEVAARAREETR
jgi:5-methyltetrahydropteroyltriglutamate--homocysteine methyltransferase